MKFSSTMFKTLKKSDFACSHLDLLTCFQEDFLEDINSILNSGEVPELFDKEEIDGICIDIKNLAMEKELPDTQTALYGFFLEVSISIKIFCVKCSSVLYQNLKMTFQD